MWSSETCSLHKRALVSFVESRRLYLLTRGRKWYEPASQHRAVLPWGDWPTNEWDSKGSLVQRLVANPVCLFNISCTCDIIPIPPALNYTTAVRMSPHMTTGITKYYEIALTDGTLPRSILVLLSGIPRLLQGPVYIIDHPACWIHLHSTGWREVNCRHVAYRSATHQSRKQIIRQFQISSHMSIDSESGIAIYMDYSRTK